MPAFGAAEVHDTFVAEVKTRSATSPGAAKTPESPGAQGGALDRNAVHHLSVVRVLHVRDWPDARPIEHQFVRVDPEDALVSIEESPRQLLDGRRGHAGGTRAGGVEVLPPERIRGAGKERNGARMKERDHISPFVESRAPVIAVLGPEGTEARGVRLAWPQVVQVQRHLRCAELRPHVHQLIERVK